MINIWIKAEDTEALLLERVKESLLNTFQIDQFTKIRNKAMVPLFGNIFYQEEGHKEICNFIDNP